MKFLNILKLSSGIFAVIHVTYGAESPEQLDVNIKKEQAPSYHKVNNRKEVRPLIRLGHNKGKFLLTINSKSEVSLISELSILELCVGWSI